MQRRAERDELFVNEALRMDVEGPLAPPWVPRVTGMDVLRHDGAVERLLAKKIDALAKDSSDIEALLDYISYFKLYLELELPHKDDLYREPFSFLISVLDQARKGSLHPVIARQVHSRPTDSNAKKKFKVACVVAADLHYEADQRAGLKRRFVTRPQADAIIYRKQRVQQAAKKLGLPLASTTIRGWRREMREAHEGSALRIAEEIARAGAQKVLRTLGLKEAVEYLLNRISNDQHIT